MTALNETNLSLFCMKRLEEDIWHTDIFSPYTPWITIARIFELLVFSISRVHLTGKHIGTPCLPWNNLPVWNVLTEPVTPLEELFLKANSCSASQNILLLSCNQKSTLVLRKARPWFISEPKGSSPQPSTLFLLHTFRYYHAIGLQSGLFSLGFPNHIVYTFLVYSNHATCCSHFNFSI
jgi:hypothetical protein